ncbi:hypothetical protein MNBD_GAMMA04-1973 [hydrothermal vent metagenome]|uniref:Uncharacterized protein n=1 Tax=hydrothermal vent metagenome TaxID=652676 RepID=A0A3B0VY42_9ZZZZ
MQLTYQKLGQDHPMYGKVDFLVADGTTPICYKTKVGYVALESNTAVMPTKNLDSATDVTSKPLYVLSFKVNGEAEEMTFSSKKKLDKRILLFSEKTFITDIKTKVYKTIV